jgi:hypothetical protein
VADRAGNETVVVERMALPATRACRTVVRGRTRIEHIRATGVACATARMVAVAAARRPVRFVRRSLTCRRSGATARYRCTAPGRVVTFSVRKTA